ncbi:MAG: hypothetical protein IKX67_07675 [Bacteroidales bacterium]|nr:hypothetical protein [Bacteroidales bacterium]
MEPRRFFILAALAAISCAVSCNKEAVENDPSPDAYQKVAVSFSAIGEPEQKATLDFTQTQNVRWSDDDLIAVFDGIAKNQFSIEAGSNTGASATYTGEVTSGYSTLYAVYPYSAAGSLSGSSLTVTVPSAQVVSSTACVDPAALLSVGEVSDGTIEFKQVCGLLKFQIDTTNIAKVILHGTNLAGTATVAATGILSSVTEGENSIEITYAGGNFAKDRYFAAVLPGTTAANSFTVEFVEDTGLSYVKSVTKAVTVVRKEGKSIGAYDNTYALIRHITNKDQLYAWGANMGNEHGVTVYLDADIDCASDPWTYTGVTFDGIFEGQSHKIYNLIVTSDADNTGFISRLTGTLKNLTIGSSNGSSWDNVSTITHNGTSASDNDTRYLGLVGRAAGDATMIDVTNYAKITADATNSRVYIGGLVGLVPGNESVTLNNCKNYGAVVNNSTWTGGQTRMGGIVGQCSGKLDASDVENHGDLTVNNSVTNFVGGLCGDLGAGSVVGDSINYGTITFTDSGTQETFIGGCFGSVRGSTISNCHNYAAISSTRKAKQWFGGILGLFETGETTVSNCVNHTGADLSIDSSVNSNQNKMMGGIAGGCGYNGSGPFAISILSCRNEAAITNNGAGTHFGGIVGQFDNYYASGSILIEGCENTGNVASTVTDNTINVSQELRIGGILGMIDPESAGCRQTVRSCINRGNVSVSGALKSGASVRFGGIVGHAYNDAEIDQCKNFGNVSIDAAGGDAGSAVFYAGGILGFINTRSSTRYQQVTDCINTGTISSIRTYSNHYLGGIIGSGTNADAYPQIARCKNYGYVSDVKTSGSVLGGVCGYTCYTLTDNSNFGDINGGQWQGSLVGDGNAKAVTSNGNKSGNGVQVNSVSVPVANGTYSYDSSGDLSQRKYFCGGLGYDGTAFTITVVDQETYSE